MSSKPKKLFTWDRAAESRRIFERINKNHINMLISLSRPDFYVDFPNDVPKHLEFPGRGLSNKPKVGPKRSGDKAMLEAKEFLGGYIDGPRRRSQFSGCYNMNNMWKEVDAHALEEKPKDQKRSRQSSSSSSSSSSYNKHLYAGSIGSKPCCTPKAREAAGIDIDYSKRPKHPQAKRSTQSLSKVKASAEAPKKPKRSPQRKSTKKVPDSRSSGTKKRSYGRIDVFTSSSSSEPEDDKPAESAVEAYQAGQEAAAGSTVDVQQECQATAAVNAQQEVQHSPKLIEPAESSDDGAFTPTTSVREEALNGSDTEDLDEESDKDQETDDDEDSAKDDDYRPSTSVAALFKKPVVKAEAPREPNEEPIFTVELDDLKIKLRKEESMAVFEKVM